MLLLHNYHLMNTVIDTPHVYSCAVDSFLELSYHAIYPYLKNIAPDLTIFCNLIYQVCEKYKLHLSNEVENLSVVYELISYEVRSPVWHYIQEKCPSFRPRDCNAQFSEIFQEVVFGILNDTEKALFMCSFSYDDCCNICRNTIQDSIDSFVQYVFCDEPRPEGFETNWPSFLSAQNFFVQNISCYNCTNKTTIRNSLLTPATVLFLEFSVSLMNVVNIFDKIVIGNIHYKLAGVIRNKNSHFTVAVKVTDGWMYIDDLIKSSYLYCSFEELKYVHPEGWFFCCYTLQNQFEVLNDSQYLSNSCSNFRANEVETQNLCNFLDDHSKKDSDFPCQHNLFDYDIDFETQSENKNNFFKSNTTDKKYEYTHQSKDLKHVYNEHNYSKRAIKENYCQNEFNVHHEHSYSKCIEKENYVQNEELNANFQDYFTNFDIPASEFHERGRNIMQKFHNKMNHLEILQCNVCKESWFHIKRNLCGRCKRDKCIPKKFSEENCMIPSKLPIELSGLTQAEEMLIARAFPVMNVYCKPRGGQKAYKGHVITFPSNVQKIADILPNYPKDLPIIRLVSSNGDFKSKDFRVRRQKIVDALRWLVKNNPVYHNVIIDQNRIAMLPEDDDLRQLTELTLDCFEEDTPLDRGHCDGNEVEEISTFIPVNLNSKKQKDLVFDHINEAIELDFVGENPLSEFRTEFIATMSFPTLFPDCKGDPTSFSIVRNIAASDTESFSLKLKHLLKFGEYIEGKWHYRFAAHPRFSYWGFNMLYRKRILSKGNLYVKRNPGDLNFTLEEFNEMLNSHASNALMSKLFYYSKDLTGSNSYWNKVKQDLNAILKQVGVPTIFFTLSMAEFHWPDFLRLFDLNENCTKDIRTTILNNPHIVDYYFTERTEAFVKSWLYEYLGASWHWFRYEFAALRGSIHCHGLAKLKNDPGLVELTNLALKGFIATHIKEKNDILSEDEIILVDYDIELGKYAEQIVCNYVDNLLTTINPTDPTLWSKSAKHPCKVPFADLKPDNIDIDYVALVNSVQKHTCSSLYCLKKKGDQLVCRFKYPFELASQTTIEFTEIHTKDGSSKYRAEIKTARNDSRLNRHQRVQLQGWRANCDISVVIDYHSCLEYLTKYASKPEKLTTVAKDAFTHVASTISNDEFDSAKVIKKLMMRAVGLRDMSIQEVCHQILKLKLYSCSFEVVTISLDGSRKVDNVDGELITRQSMLDLYAKRENLTNDLAIRNSNFINFFSNYYVKNNKIKKRHNFVVVRSVPNFSSYRQGVNYSKYCKYNLIKYKVWSNSVSFAWDGLEECDENFILCWAQFLRSENASELVPGYTFELENLENLPDEEDEEDDVINPNEEREEWMFLSEFLNTSSLNIDETTNDQFVQADEDYWAKQRTQFTQQEIGNMPSWINSKKNVYVNNYISASPDEREYIEQLNSQQRKAFDLVVNHAHSNSDQLLLLITGKAGTGKSFLIDRLRYALGKTCCISALFGIAAFNISGKTLHYLLKMPIKGKHAHDLNGAALAQVQERFVGVKYLIIDEYSVVSQRELSWINRRCKQATGIAESCFGGINIILVGDLGQLPPVSGKVLYDVNPINELESEGYFLYSQFCTVIELTRNERVKGQNFDRYQFCELLARVRDGEVSVSDWQLLLTRTATNCVDVNSFSNALRLSYGNKQVAEDNFNSLKAMNIPIAKCVTIHSKPLAARLSADDIGGLTPCLFLCVNARVMLTRNLWTEVGLCNGALGSVRNIIYAEGIFPPSLPAAVFIQFDTYTGPSFIHDIPNCVPIAPLSNSSETHGPNFERTQFPLKLAWAITIHKSQGLTLPKVWIDLGRKEQSPGLSYVALSRVRALEDLMIEPMSLDRLQDIKKNKRIQYRKVEEQRLHTLAMQ